MRRLGFVAIVVGLVGLAGCGAVADDVSQTGAGGAPDGAGDSTVQAEGGSSGSAGTGGGSADATSGDDAAPDGEDLDAMPEPSDEDGGAVDAGDEPDAALADAAEEDGDAADASAEGVDDGATDASLEAGDEDAVAPDATDEDAGDGPYVCLPPLSDCSGTCVDLASDLSNCGSCGHVCGPSGSFCVCFTGLCRWIEGPPGWSDCNHDCADGAETNVSTSPNNCGACGNLCSLPHATAGCAGGVCTVAKCDVGWGDCDGSSINGCETSLTNDPSNCGACGAACTAPNGTPFCAAGTCACGCTAGYADCDASCANGCETALASNALNCGACGAACTVAHGTPKCTSFVCGIAKCDAGWADCDGQYANGCETNVSSDPSNCGSCGSVCAGAPDPTCPGKFPGCVNGVCPVSTCATGFCDCDGNAANGCETSTTNNPNDCGGCGIVCPTPANANAKCTGTTCGFTCKLGFGNCDGQAANGCETSLATDPSNCGGCGLVCPASGGVPSPCISGVCAPFTCPLGLANCDGNAANGCETSISIDVSNCGGCGIVCPARPNATTACNAATCGFTCKSGFANCDGQAANGCETSVASDVNNCGACGHVCPGCDVCLSGICLAWDCNPGFADCDGLCATGCETAIKSDPKNCGACGNVCSLPHATPSCLNAMCQIAACDAGWGNCDGFAQDGCEANLATDVKNCGTCGVVCGAGLTCNLGSCQ